MWGYTINKKPWKRLFIYSEGKLKSKTISRWKIRMCPNKELHQSNSVKNSNWQVKGKNEISSAQSLSHMWHRGGRHQLKMHIIKGWWAPEFPAPDTWKPGSEKQPEKGCHKKSWIWKKGLDRSCQTHIINDCCPRNEGNEKKNLDNWEAAEIKQTRQFRRIKSVKKVSNSERSLRKKFSGEFDPGSGWTLAACLIHASRTGTAMY